MSDQGNTFQQSNLIQHSQIGGDVNQHIYLPPEPAKPDPLVLGRELFATMPLDSVPAVAPLPAGSHVLFSPNKTFVGRVDELQHLAQILATQRTTAIATGIGGIGKTTLASEFAHRYGQYFSGGVFWLSFADPNAVHVQIAVCGAKGGLNLHPNFENLDLAEQYSLVMRYWQTAPPCLLIFDNCEDSDLLQFVPPTGEARVLITSRRRLWDATHGAEVLELGKLRRADSLDMLGKYFRATAAEYDRVADTLGDLPLALHLAGRYIAHDELSVDEYLSELAAVAVLEHESLKDTPRNLTATFALSYDKLDANNTVDACAIQLLARAACFAHGEPLPSDLLKQTLDTEPKLLRKALARLTKEVGLLEPEGDNLRLHRLLAQYIQQRTSDDTAQAAVEQVMIDIAYNLGSTGIPSKLQPLQTHLRWITEQALQRDNTTAATLANNLGYHLKSLGEYAAARALYERALAIREAVLGADHPDTAQSLNNLALLLNNLGEYAAARPLYERALAIRETVLGAAHPDTAQSLNNLAALLDNIGEYEAARPLYERALAIHERVLGADHPSTATSLNNLALLLNNLGEYAAARPLYERALAISETVLGADHPDTAQSLNNLALLLNNLGEYAAARPLLERALAIHETVLGADHPSTALSLNNLAELLRNMGEYEAARALYERALAIRERVLGAAHPDTAQSLNNLAGLFYNEGDVAQAIEYMRQALAIDEQVYGKDHPDVAIDLNNLAALFYNEGDVAQAIEYMRQALAIDEQVYGKDHPDVAIDLNNLAGLFYNEGDVAQAIAYTRRALAIFERVLGHEHPNTRTVRGNLEYFENIEHRA